MIDILKIVLPALLVLVTAYVVLHKFLLNEEKNRLFELKKNNLATITPIRLRAYERLMLVLERTSPNALVVATVRPGMKALELQTKLLDTIRQEFSHNVSQQIYISNELWSAVRVAQESLIQLVNVCAGKVQAEDDAVVLAEIIIQVYASSEDTPTEQAIGLLKDEVRILF
ncbi:MAG: hypothetical protein H6Q20_2444 [Bacteroidetes bacterium]|nr:hypothetical protein [Bacteroidota bacterium]